MPRSVNNNHPRFATLRCPICKGEFRVWWAQRDTRRYCSRACSGVGRRRYMRELAPNPDWAELIRLDMRIADFVRVNATLREQLAARIEELME